mmetsp:Transcript_677/g.1767  ORF Transcript_677/g.1767 Transcript_677/m.1767 type:complete len:285 (+) Transcript_677:2-856(+)
MKGEVRFYDRPRQNRRLLEGLRAAHEGDLAEMHCTATGTEETKSQSVLSLVDYALATLSIGTQASTNLEGDWESAPQVGWDATEAVFNELLSQRKKPIMIVADGMNHIYGTSNFKTPKGHMVHSTAIRPCRFWQSLKDRVVAANKIEGSPESSPLHVLVVAESRGTPHMKAPRFSRVATGVDFPKPDSLRDDPNGHEAYRANFVHHAMKYPKPESRNGPEATPSDRAEVTTVTAELFTEKELGGLCEEYERIGFVTNMKKDVMLKLAGVSGGAGHVFHDLLRSV